MKKTIRKAIALCLTIAVLLAQTTAVYGAVPAKVNLSAAQTSKNTVTLNWKKTEGAEGYQIFRKDGAGGTFRKIKSLSGESSVSFKDTGLDFGKKYYYKVRAFDRTGSKVTKGSFSTTRVVTMTNIRPVLSVYIPSAMDKKNKTITISVTNSSRNDTIYFDGVFAVENLADSGKTYNAPAVKWEKPAASRSGTLKSGTRLTVKPGEKVRFTCELETAFDYKKEQLRLTTVVKYKKKDYVSVYTVKTKNKIYTEAEYYEFLMKQ